ncbi:hypothetical protein QA645_41030 [Bradyrhizobium sp. CIAT3101]|uniref:hypothetical protein n=1 Tax=Bradyrhizobium sp. CIAT3101 TaxID=439387 RepID=UPI0024B0F08A|nr:hypothetical protein [Bradyrhizobium sp. CIAT3101]WFU80734.1 hypothetical protein QA645_41030 [Bradyrhizobium sp. CIAT3101]
MRKYLRFLVCLLCFSLSSSAAFAQLPIIARAVTRAFAGGDAAAIVASRSALDVGRTLQGAGALSRRSLLDSTALSTTMGVTGASSAWSRDTDAGLSTDNSNSISLGASEVLHRGGISGALERAADEREMSATFPAISSNIRESCTEKANTPKHSRASDALMTALNKQAAARLSRSTYLGLEANDNTSEMLIRSWPNARTFCP